MNFPLVSDLDFVRNLKEKDKLYLVSAEWNSDKGSMLVKPDIMVFKGFETDTKVFDSDNTTILANLSKKGSSAVEKHNLYYGFYPTPLAALEAFKSFADIIASEASLAVEDEKKKLEKKKEKKKAKK